MPALCRHPLCLSRGPLSLLSSARGPVDAGTRPVWRIGWATVGIQGRHRPPRASIGLYPSIPHPRDHSDL